MQRIHSTVPVTYLSLFYMKNSLLWNYYTNTIITVFRFVLENIAWGLSTNRADVVVGMTEVNIPGTNLKKTVVTVFIARIC